MERSEEMENEVLLQLLKKYVPFYDEEALYKEQMINFISSNTLIQGKENEDGHITGSAWIINLQENKVLLTHHGKLDIWVQLGGHSHVGETPLDTALREAKEESGLTSIHPVTSQIFDLDIHLIPERKNEKFHHHYDIRFLMKADDQEKLMITKESKDLKWVDLSHINDFTRERSILRMVEKLNQNRY